MRSSMMGLKLGASSPVDLTFDFGSLQRRYVTWELTIAVCSKLRDISASQLLDVPLSRMKVGEVEVA